MSVECQGSYEQGICETIIKKDFHSHHRSPGVKFDDRHLICRQWHRPTGGLGQFEFFHWSLRPAPEEEGQLLGQRKSKTVAAQLNDYVCHRGSINWIFLNT